MLLSQELRDISNNKFVTAEVYIGLSDDAEVYIGLSDDAEVRKQALPDAGILTVFPAINAREIQDGSLVAHKSDAAILALMSRWDPSEQQVCQSN